MERELYIFEMSDTSNPILLAHSRLMQGRLLKEYAAIRARRAISLKSVPHSECTSSSLGSCIPDALLVSALLLLWVLAP
jgi:hypothetical protein